MSKSTNVLFLLVSVFAISGCAGNIKYNHALDNLPDDPSYFAPDAKITRNSKLVPRNVKVRKAPAAATVDGANDPKLYEEFEADFTNEYFPEYLNGDCDLNKNSKGTDGMLYVDAEIEAVLFKKAGKQLLGQVLFGALASAMQDSMMIKGDFSVLDSSGKLVASQKGGLVVVLNAPLLKWNGAPMWMRPEIRRLCGMLEASINEMEQKNTQPSGASKPLAEQQQIKRQLN